jgi:hypothetical protein
MNTKPSSCSLRRVAVLFALTLGAFAAGWVSANLLYATSLNLGLVKALDSVGQSLIGSAVFSAHAIPVDPCIPGDPCRSTLELNIGDDVEVPVTTNVYTHAIPTEPCRTYLQVAFENGVAVVKYDPAATPPGFNSDIQAANLSAVVPATSQCPASFPCTDCDQ